MEAMVAAIKNAVLGCLIVLIGHFIILNSEHEMCGDGGGDSRKTRAVACPTSTVAPTARGCSLDRRPLVAAEQPAFPTSSQESLLHSFVYDSDDDDACDGGDWAAYAPPPSLSSPITQVVAAAAASDQRAPPPRHPPPLYSDLARLDAIRRHTPHGIAGSGAPSNPPPTLFGPTPDAAAGVRRGDDAAASYSGYSPLAPF